MKKYFINLSAGLMQTKYSGEIIRIQSSHLESKSFDRLFYGLSDSLLYHLAQNDECYIVDCSSNATGKVKKIGVPIIKAILTWRWFKEREVKGFDRVYLERIKRSLSRHTKRKIDYYAKFNPKEINLDALILRVDKENYWENKA